MPAAAPGRMHRCSLLAGVDHGHACASVPHPAPLMSPLSQALTACGLGPPCCSSFTPDLARWVQLQRRRVCTGLEPAGEGVYTNPCGMSRFGAEVRVGASAAVGRGGRGARLAVTGGTSTWFFVAGDRSAAHSICDGGHSGHSRRGECRAATQPLLVWRAGMLATLPPGLACKGLPRAACCMRPPAHLVSPRLPSPGLRVTFQPALLTPPPSCTPAALPDAVALSGPHDLPQRGLPRPAMAVHAGQPHIRQRVPGLG